MRYLILLLALSSQLFATQYYVRTDGLDSHAGTSNSSGSAWLTIAHATATAAAGDIVTVVAGTYGENASISASGTSGNPITYNTLGGTVTTGGFNITGSYITMSGFTLNGASVGAGDGLIEIRGNHCRFSTMTLTGTAGTLTSTCYGVHFSFSDRPSGPSDDQFTGFTVNNLQLHAVVSYGTGHVFDGWTVRGTNGWDAFWLLSSNTTVKNCDISLSNPLSNPNHCDCFQTFGDDPVDVSQNNIIEKNYVHDCPGYQLGILTDDQENSNISAWTFRNNLFVDVDNCYNLYGPNCSFYNNTFIRVGPVSSWAIIWGSSGAGHSDSTTIRNNIFYQCGASTSATQGWYTGDAVTGLVTDHNLVVGSGGGTTKSGYSETGSINGSDPVFVSSTDFHIQTTSPAKDAGSTIGSFSTDYAGTTRPQGSAWDMGAYEFTSGVVAPVQRYIRSGGRSQIGL